MDVLDVSKQCFSLHVGGCVTHVSDVSGMEEHFICNVESQEGLKNIK